jgi:hypothetical protein
MIFIRYFLTSKNEIYSTIERGSSIAQGVPEKDLKTIQSKSHQVSEQKQTSRYPNKLNKQMGKINLMHFFNYFMGFNHNRLFSFLIVNF